MENMFYSIEFRIKDELKKRCETISVLVEWDFRRLEMLNPKYVS
jgi:hypothetical protein